MSALDYTEHAEVAIVRLAARGDRLAYDELVKRRHVDLRQFLRRLCNDAALADDIAQQALLTAWMKLGTLKQPAAFAPWLKRIALNTWRTHARRVDPLADAYEHTGESSPEQAHQPAAAMGLDLNAALATLAPDTRLCVVLAYHEGLSHREIVEATDLALGTVKSNIRRGSQVLQDYLAAYRASGNKQTDEVDNA